MFVALGGRQILLAALTFAPPEPTIDPLLRLTWEQLEPQLVMDYCNETAEGDIVYFLHCVQPQEPDE